MYTDWKLQNRPLTTPALLKQQLKHKQSQEMTRIHRQVMQREWYNVSYGRYEAALQMKHL